MQRKKTKGINDDFTTNPTKTNDFNLYQFPRTSPERARSTGGENYVCPSENWEAILEERPRSAQQIAASRFGRSGGLPSCFRLSSARIT
jgi:hypothetical protein